MDGAPPPPPPPPHGENPNTTGGEYRKSSDLPQGNYDIFIVPPHSSGGGFLYLPSLQCNRNSFLAGVASTLFVGMVWTLISPIIRAWYIAAVSGGNNMGIVVVALGLGVAGWAFGISQSDGSKGNNGGGRGFGGGSGSGGPNAHSQSSGAGYGGGPGQQQYGGAGGSGQQQQQQQGGNFGGGQNRGNQYAGNQHGSGPPPTQDSKKHGADGAEWERAREETKRKEELRRKMEEFKRKREAEAKEKERKREREAMEKELKERREQLEKEMAAAREKAEKEAREKAEKETAEAKVEAERLAAEAKDKAEKEAAEKEAAAKAQAQKEAMAKFAALKEAAAKRYAEKKAAEAMKEKGAGIKPPASATSAPRTPSPKKPPFPTARTTIEEDDAYSFRPYDRPRRPYVTSAYSESSYAPSQSTARTTPPPSHRGTYSTKDPDKIVIQGVYQFNNAFNKTPVAQLVSGQGMVTDGLVLRITTEGLFIDDDLRGVGQREWDVKAWTLKLAEAAFLKTCKNTCRLASPAASFARSAAASGVNSSGPPQAEFRGLHVLRASIRDQEGKRYVFVVQDTEAWKVAIGLQRLRAGALVRALGVSALPVPECKSILGGLGYI
ncbi:uncharacterized protein N7498_001115 [Penicillium cinerascens]|uniref:Uncharacterized protein n=1 Tax=Penicillium cinerascens TaxID=70096 RepID=A0A9W9NFL6_9EURO|nr:uncharacterized protein N7498_001115 [Penicillium cinerascens]KAJ5219016.1 hypothetical protein N7498_001115 [Penicillium cinerascens]